jgi:ribosomal protein S27E
MLILGILIFLGGMLWLSKLQRHPTMPVYCPYCAGRNDLFRGRTEFSCDMCGRRVVMTSAGEAVPGEPEDAAE